MKGLSHPQLMRVSQRCVEDAAISRDALAQRVAARVLTDVDSQYVWEREHSGYMHEVADCSRRRSQLVALRAVELRLIHRRAVFQYLRSIATDEDQRRRVVALFHHSLTYTGAVVAEHRLFVRSTLSQLCAEHIGRAVVGDPAFGEPLRDYVSLYTAYFRLFCETHTQPADSDNPCCALLSYLKPQVVEQRRSILALSARP